MFCTNCGKRLIEGQYACPDCGTRRAAMAGKTAHVIRITRARLAVIIAASVIVSLLAGSLVTWGVARGTGAGGSTAITGLASAQTPPSIDGTWVSQGELDRPFTLNNGVITTSDIEDEPGKGTYTISDKPDDNGYYVLDLRFDEMNECTSDTADTLESCKGQELRHHPFRDPAGQGVGRRLHQLVRPASRALQETTEEGLERQILRQLRVVPGIHVVQRRQPRRLRPRPIHVRTGQTRLLDDDPPVTAVPIRCRTQTPSWTVRHVPSTVPRKAWGHGTRNA